MSVDKELAPIKIMVASTVIGFESILRQICAVLESYGYEVINSDFGTVFANPKKSNKDNCIEAVKECDIFLGIIRPQYGTGVINDISITHYEIKTAIKFNKPRWFVTHRDVPVFRIMFDKIKVEDSTGKSIKLKDYKGLIIEKNSFFDNRKIIDMYNEASRNDIKDVARRKNNWVQPFYSEEDLLRYIKKQFSSMDTVRRIVLE